MKHISTTPFGRRPVDAGHLATRALAEAPAPMFAPDKWLVLQDLVEARCAFDITNRDLTVLSALLSFHPGKVLDAEKGLIVFPSNRSLSTRAHGMAESTLRRHLTALVRAGLILRHDSPNGKRYARRSRDGVINLAFGFDLSPLALRAAEIARAADAAREAHERFDRLREETVLRLRDISKLIDYAESEGLAPCPGIEPRLEMVRRHLRRKLSFEQLQDLHAELATVYNQINTVLSPPETKKMDGNVVEIERHHQSSKQNTIDKECCSETSNNPAVETPKLPIFLVIKACPSILEYGDTPITHWRQLIERAEVLRPMLGIRQEVWIDAKAKMGQSAAAVTLSCILQRFGTIRNPSAYLRSLAQKTEAGSFSPNPMVMALLNNHAA